MANLKVDLVNKINNDKFYEEIELIRLAQEPNMNYKDKIENMQYRLERLAILNSQVGLVEQYFQDQPKADEVAPAPQQEGAPAPQANVHQGQSHGE